MCVYNKFHDTGTSISRFFADCDVVHTSALVKGNLTADNTINKLSVLEERILITKDSDFYYSYIARKKPFKLVLVKFGNMRLKDLLEYFERNAIKIKELIAVISFIILEEDRIRILE